MKKLFLTIGFAAGTLLLAAQPQVVAHRGFHAAEGSWENTVSSLRNAQKLGVYGVEFDVNMTADDSLIVYHGPKILDTKLHAQKNRFAEIRAVKLPGGLEIPTLREFFAQGQKDSSTKLILEIKKHATPQRETQVVEAILRLAREMRLVPQIEFISFSRHACDEVLRLQPDAVVVYVSSDMAAMSPAEAKKRGYGGLSYQLNVLMNRPELVTASPAFRPTVPTRPKPIWKPSQPTRTRNNTSAALPRNAPAVRLRRQKRYELQPPHGTDDFPAGIVDRPGIGLRGKIADEP